MPTLLAAALLTSVALADPSSRTALKEASENGVDGGFAWLKATGADPDRLNVNGGAIALGHPLGASGTKLTTTLVHALKKRNKRYGLQTMCEGGGMANVTIFECL